MENKMTAALIIVLTLVTGWVGIMLHDFGERIRMNTMAISALKVDVVRSVGDLDKTLSVFIATAKASKQSVSFTSNPNEKYVGFTTEQDIKN